MSWSCSSQAHSTLNIIQSICAKQTGTSNSWIDGGRSYFFEVTKKEHSDGAITGTIYRMQGSSATKAGRLNIAGNGRIHIFNHCPLKHRNWKARYEKVKAAIFGNDSFVQVDDSDLQTEYDEPSVAEVGNLKDISPNKALTLSNGKIFIKCTSAPHFGNTMLVADADF